MQHKNRKGQLGLLQTAVITFLIVGIIGGLAVTINSRFVTTARAVTDGGSLGSFDGENETNTAVQVLNSSIIGTKDLLSFQSILALVIVGVIVLGLIGLFNRRS